MRVMRMLKRSSRVWVKEEQRGGQQRVEVGGGGGVGQLLEQHLVGESVVVEQLQEEHSEHDCGDGERGDAEGFQGENVGQRVVRGGSEGGAGAVGHLEPRHHIRQC